MTHDDVSYRFRLRLFVLVDELGNVRAACRKMRVPSSTYYRRRKSVRRWGLNALRLRERRPPQSPRRTPPWPEQHILAPCLGPSGLGRTGWRRSCCAPGGGTIGAARTAFGICWAARTSLPAPSAWGSLPATSSRPSRGPWSLSPPAASRRRNRGTWCNWTAATSANWGPCGRTWQYTAINVASSFTWATRQNTPQQFRGSPHRGLGPAGRRCPGPPQLAGRRVSIDNADEFTNATYSEALHRTGVHHTRIRAGRPQSNGCAERVHQTIVAECSRLP